MSNEITTKEVIKSMQMSVVNTPDDMHEFYELVREQLEGYNVPPEVTETILARCTNGTLESTIKTLELNNVQID